MVRAKEFIEKKRNLQEKYRFPDTRYSPDIFVALFEHIERLEQRIIALEKKVNR